MGNRLGIDVPSMIHHTCTECGEQWSEVPEGFDKAFLAVATKLNEDVRLWASLMLPRCSCGCPNLKEVAEFSDGSHVPLASSPGAIKEMAT